MVHLLKMETPDKVLVIIDPIEIKKAVLVNDILSVIWELDSHLRNIIKYTEKEDTSKEEKVREKLHELLDEKSINLEELFS